MLASFDPSDPSAIVVQDQKGERFFGVPLVPDVPAIADTETLSLGAKETAAFNRVAKARYSELAAKWLPKGRPVAADAQARETARKMADARTAGREQYRRRLGPEARDPAEVSPSADRLRALQDFLRGES